MYNESLEKRRASRVYLTFSVLFFVFAIGTGFIMAKDRGFGAGWWDTKHTWSCYTPGGPYYLPDKPLSEQPCPSPTSMNLKARLPLGEVSATSLAPAPPVKRAVSEAKSAVERLGIPPILKDTFLIVTSFATLFLIIWWWSWLMKNFGTF